MVHMVHMGHMVPSALEALPVWVWAPQQVSQQKLSALSSASLSAECQTGGAAFTGKGLGAISPGSNSPRQVG